MSKIWDALKKAELEREPVLPETGELPERRLLTPKQRLAVDALLSSASRAAAATACGVSERTLLRWIKLPAFAAAYQAAGRAQFTDAQAQLKAASRDAAEVLRGALGDADAGVRVRAAAAILDAASRAELAAVIQAAARKK
ncbi:MAG: hypothetical protein SF182_19205 [Deltaproteobacteria bacterium]|nr:hypothetical protein [Deltaproteobacteria bacterium]